MDEAIIRAAQDDDSGGLIRMIDAIYCEFSGCVLDVDNEAPELRAPASAAAADNGQWWVVERRGEIVGSVALVPGEGGSAELRKLYVAAQARRNGLGARLVRVAEDEARSQGAASIMLWSDTRFADAHRLYERLGFVRATRMRALGDISNSVEYHFSKDILP
jgi:N-acetylglutamate synthase-like GNAT family acetyltransferase